MESKTRRKTAVIAGATGYLGKRVVRVLHGTGWRVRALVRDPARLGFAAQFADEVFVGEATDPETLKGLCEGADAVVSSIGVRHFHRRPTIWEVDEAANLNLLRAAESAKVPQFVFVSFLHADRMRGRIPVAEARERVVDAMRRSPVRGTVLRPTGFFNDMREFLDMARRGRVWLVGDGSARINPVDGEDVADVVREVLWEGTCAPSEIEIGGPDTYTLDDIARLACEAAGHEVKLGHIPAWMLSMAVGAARPFNTNAHGLGRMFVEFVRSDGLAPPRGRRHLADYYRACLAA